VWSWGEVTLIAGEVKGGWPLVALFGGEPALGVEVWGGVSGGRTASVERRERERLASGGRRAGSGLSVSGSSSSLSISTMGKVMARRKTLGAATTPSIFSQMVLSSQE